VNLTTRQLIPRNAFRLIALTSCLFSLSISSSVLAAPIEIHLFVDPQNKRPICLNLTSLVEETLIGLFENQFDLDKYNIISIPKKRRCQKEVQQYAQEEKIASYLHVKVRGFVQGMSIDVQMHARGKQYRIKKPIVFGPQEKGDTVAITEKLLALPIIYSEFINGRDPEKIVFVYCFKCSEKQTPIKSCDITIGLPLRLKQTKLYELKYTFHGMDLERFEKYCTQDPRNAPSAGVLLNSYNFSIFGYIIKTDNLIQPEHVNIQIRIERKKPKQYYTLKDIPLKDIPFGVDSKLMEIAEKIATYLENVE